MIHTSSNSSSSVLHETTIRNAFLAGVCSTSLLWGFVTWSIKRINTSRKQQYILDDKGHSKKEKEGLGHRHEKSGKKDAYEDGNEWGFCDNDDDGGGNHERSSSLTVGMTGNLSITEEMPSEDEDSDDPYTPYNPWKTSEESTTIQYRQLLELRTALIEQSKRTSLMLLDKILSQTKRIGELPSARKRIRWPWESLRRHLNESDDKNNSIWSKSVSTSLSMGVNGENNREEGENADNDSKTIGYCPQPVFPTQGSSGSASNARTGVEGCKTNGAGLPLNSSFGNSFGDDNNSTGDHQSLHMSSSNASHSQYTASSAETKAEICIGSIFGLDVGGTLSKLVYFEMKKEKNIHNDHRRGSATSSNTRVPRAQSSRAMSNSLSHSPMRNFTVEGTNDMSWSNHSVERSYPLRRGHASCDYSMDDLSFETSWSREPPEEKKLKRSHSLFDITSKKAKREQALERFYEFARRLDTYDSEVKDKSLSFYSRALGGEFHFIQFETRHLSQAMDLIKFNDLHLDISRMGATGGGAHKYADEWERYLGIEIAKQDELDSLVAGMQFTLSDVVGECYTFKPQPIRERSSSTTKDQSKDSDSHNSKPKYKIDQYWWSRKVKRDFVAKSDSYPYLLVMIGTGVSVLRVDGPRRHERISGSTIGGGTYWGLCRLLTDVEDFESVLSLAERGDPSKVDMMVGDIYGKESDALEKLGLTADIVASSFGKLVAKADPAEGLKQEDLARALLLMVTNNIGQVSYLNAQLHNTKRIYFVGNFLRHNNLSQRRLAYAINYWSRGKMEALFLEHEGYYGALGSFLLHQGISNDRDGKVAQSKDGPISVQNNGKVRKRERKQRSMSL